MNSNISFDDMIPIDKKIEVEAVSDDSVDYSGDSIVITDDFIMAGMSGNGGFNYAQLKLLGVPTPPRTGWKDTIIGKTISKEIAQKYLSMKGKTKSVVRKEKNALIQKELFSGPDTIELTESDRNIIRFCVEERYNQECEKQDR
jgi:hypothetical protein